MFFFMYYYISVTNTVIVLHNDEHRYIGELESDVIDHEEKHQAKFRDNIFSTWGYFFKILKKICDGEKK